MKSLSVLLSVLVYNTLIRFTASRDVSFEVDGGVLYDITWLSREEVVPDLDPDASGSSDDGVLAELLPNTLLGEGQWAEETIVMRTPENEQYECLLPALDPDSKDEVCAQACMSLHMYVCMCAFLWVCEWASSSTSCVLCPSTSG